MSWIDDRIKERENRSQNAKNSQNGKKGKTQSAQNGQAGSGASSWVDQRLNERQQQERARQEKALQQEREWMLQQKKLEASQRTSKRSQVMLQGFHKDPLNQAASEAELAVKQYQREQQIYQTMMKNAGSSEARQRQTIEQANAGFNAVTGKMKRYNESVKNAEAQQRKDYEQRLQELKKTNRGAYYGETLNREQIEGQLRMLEREKAELEPQVLEAENGWGGPGQTIIGGKYTDQELLYKGRSKRLQEIEDEITAYKAALNYSKQSGYEATARRLLDEQQNDTETFRKKASSGKQKFYEDQKAAKTTAETSLSKYDVDSDKGIGYTPSAKAQAFDESGYVDDLDSDYVRSWQKNVFYALYDEDPEKAKEWLRLAKENTENEYYSRLAEFAGQNAFTRTGAFLGGTALRTMSGVANLVDPFSDTALELNRGGQALISGGAQGLQEKGVFNTGFLSGKMDERIPVLGQLFGDKGLGDLYQLASSMLESGANAYVAAHTGDLSGLVGALGTIIMGSSASVADYEEGLKRGLTRPQAMQHALAAGINEAAFEYLSLDKMVNPDASASLLKKVLQQGGVEASEEFCTTIANRLADGYLSYKNGYDSQIKSRADELIALGMDRTAAIEQAEKEWTTELINDAIGGFLSGGGNMALNAAADYAASKVSDMTQKLKLLTKGQNTKKLEAVSEIDPEQNKSLSIEREISEPDNNRNQIKRIREESVQAALNEGKNMDVRQLRQMIDSYRAMLDENTDNAEFEAAAQGQIQGLEEILNQRRIEAGDDLGLAEGLGRVGVQTGNNDSFSTLRSGQNESEDVAHDVRRYGENGGLAAPGSEDIEGGLNDGGNQQLAEQAGESFTDRGQWDAGMGTEGQAGGLGKGTGRSVGGSQAKTEQARLRAQIRSLETERRSAKQIGVFGGTNNQNLHVVPAELYTGEMQEIQRKAEDNGRRVTFVAGGALELRRKGGALQKANAIYQINRDGSSEFFIRADMNRYTPGQLYAHEEFHDIAATNRGMFLDMVEDLFAHHSEEEISRMIDAYVEAMDGCYGVYEEGMSEDVQAELRNKYLEEILADQYAGMNRGGQKAQAARETAGETAQRFAGDIENARQNRAGIERRNGPGVRFSFAGKNAETANVSTLDEAQQRIADGEDSETVRQETGWYRGMDGKWRFEIDDSQMQVKPPESNYNKLKDVVGHPALFEAYPDLAETDLFLERMDDGKDGKYDPQFDTISINKAIANNAEEFKSTLIHEIQHAIQEREGFTAGASKKYWERAQKEGRDTRTVEERRAEQELRKEYEAWRERSPQFVREMEELDAVEPKVPRGEVLNWDTLESEPDPPEWVAYDQKRDELQAKYGEQNVWDFMTLQYKIREAEKRAGKLMPSDLYRRTAGEIEARNTSDRLGLDAEQRKNTRPDIDRKDVVFAPKGNGWYNSSEYNEETASIKMQIKENQERLQQMDTIVSVTVPTKFQSSKSAALWAISELKKTGYAVDNMEHGRLHFDPKSLKDGARYAHTDGERAAFVAIPAVAKRGITIGEHGDHKSRTKQTFTLAAPVELNGTRGNMAVIFNRHGNSYYAHRILLPDGTTFVFAATADINENDTANGMSRGVTENGSLAKTTSAVSNYSIAEEASDVKQRFSAADEEDVGGVDWEGNREQRLSVSDDDDGIDLSRYSGRDRVYMEAVKNGNTDEAAWMVEDAAKRAGFSHKGFHQTGADFTSFSTRNEVAGQFDDETPTGIFIKPTDEDIGLQSGTKQMPLYFKADNMLEFANREEIRENWKKNVPGYRELDAQLQARNKELEQQYDELDAEWDRVYRETYDSDDQSALDDLDRQQDEFLEKWNKELQPLRRQMKNLVTEYMKGTDYDGIHLKYDGKVYGGPRVETYIVFNPEQTKSAEPIVRDDNGNVIPLSERFRTDRTGTEAWKNRDIRFSPVEADEEAVDWNGNREEMDSSDLRADEGIAPYDTQNDYKENSGQIDRAAEEDEERPMNASPEPKTGEGGRSMSAPTEQDYAEQAREKKVELAEKLGIDGLKSRIQSAEERLKMWKTMQASGFVAKDARTQAELKQRIADVEETLKIDREVLAKKQEARKAELTDKAKRKKKASERKAEEKALKKKAELEADKPRQARKEFRQDALNLFSVPAGKRAQLGDILNRFSDKLLAQKYVSQEDRRALFTQLLEAGVEVVPADEYHQQIRSFMDEGRIYVPESVRSEFGDDWAAFRQRAWGNGIYLTNDHNDRGADAWNVELAEMFPGSFDETDTDARSVLENIVELAEEGKSEFLTIGEMMQRNRDQTGQSVDEQMDELEKKVDKLIDTFAQKAELEKKVRTEGAMKLAKERAKNREIAERQAQRQRDNQKREEVMKQLQQLSKMRKKSAPETRAKIDEIIGNLDTMARSITPAGLENLQDLARRYAEAKEDPNFLGNPYVEQRLARLSQVQLNDLEISDVIELGRTIACLVKSVQDDHRLLTDQRNREISEAAKNVNREIRSSRGSKGGKLRDFYGKSHLSPTRMLQMLGGWVRGGEMEQLSRALEDGGTKRLDYMRKATGIFDEFTSKKENQEWLKKAQGKHAEWISVTVPAGITAEDGKTKIENVTFEITPMMRVGLLMHSRNLDNLRHIDTGGIVIPNKEWYVKGDLSQADARGTRVKLRPEIVRAIVRDCTAQERAFAGLLEKYYDGFSKEKINETSMLLDGFERAGGEHYYGIKVSRKFLATQPEQVQKNMALDSIGSIVNERVHAGNPIILEDASTAVKDHIDLISKYYGFAIPIRDFNAVMNYTFHEAGDADGQANAYAGSVKETLQDVWGSGAQSYTDKLLADLQQQSGINETVARFLSKLRGNLAGASLMANPAVAISQFASYPGAMQSLGPAALAAGLKPGKVDMGLIGIYSPVLWYRNQGNSTQELGDYMKQQGFAGKLPWLFGWIQKVDSFTIRRLWAASEYYVSHNTDLAPGDQKQIDAGEDPYYQEVARVFQRAVYDTQPNYTEMQRPEVLRSESDLTKAITMYKTVPLQYYNMMFEAMGRFRADSERARQNATKENIEQAKQSKTFAARTFAGILGANVTYVVMKALVKGMTGRGKKYKDDDDEYSVESVFTGLGKDLAETYAGSIIFGGELIDAFEKFKSAVTTGNYSKYGGMEISMLSAIEDTFGDLYTLAQKLRKEDYRGGLQAVKDLAKQIAVDLGFPANNIETYLLGVLRWISPEWVDRYENFFDEFERGDMKGKHGRELSAALRVLMDNRADGLSDGTIDELQRLFETGFNQQLPSGVPSEITVDGEKTPLGWKERNEYREIWGQTVSSSLEKLIDSDAYQAADDEGKAKLIKKLYDYAGQIAAGQSAGKVMDAWAELGKACVAAGIPLEDYLGVAAVSKDKLKDMDGTELDDAIRARIYFRAGELTHDRLDEIARLYASGASSVVPADVPTSITVNKEEIKLSPEQRVTWMQEWKRVTSENLSALLASDAYKKVDDQARAKMIDSLYDVARAAACERVSDGYSPDKWIRVAFECTGRGIPIAESVIFHNSVSGLSKTAEKIDLLNSQDWPQDQKAYVWENTMASDTQLSKWENLKASGVKWKEAMQLIGVGEGSTSGMTESEKKTYQNEWDRISGPATKRLLANAAYKNANKATQAKYLDRLNDYVSKIAKSKAIKGFSVDKWVEQGQRLNQAGVPIDDYVVYYSDTSDAKSREKYSALNKTGWSNGQKMIAMEYISATTARTAEVGQRYQIGLSYYLDGLAKADANENGSISQDEAERYLDGTDLGREDKAYLWQMLCSSSKWKNNPYNVKMGEEIWHSLHPEG